MKKRFGGVLFVSVVSFLTLLLLRYGVMKNPNGQGESYIIHTFSFNKSNPLDWVRATMPPMMQEPENTPLVMPSNVLVCSLFAKRKFSSEELSSLQTWSLLNDLIDHAQGLPNAVKAIKEAAGAWDSLVASVEKERLNTTSGSTVRNRKEKQCPHFLSKMNATELGNSSYILQVPCGLTQGSSITIIGIPDGLLGNFQIDLTGEPLPGEPQPPVILHYNIRLLGDKITEDPVIVQNTWTAAHDWGEEERCPSPDPDEVNKVDELDQCSQIVGKDDMHSPAQSTNGNSSSNSSMSAKGYKARKNFPFKQGHLFVVTLRVGSEGVQMTVDGKHITSFAFRETLEPWLVGRVKISWDVKIVYVVASGLPTSDDPEHNIDIEALKSPPVSSNKPLDLFVGVFSNANNFKRRMVVRRTWMQYADVRSGTAAVRFFVGLHKNQVVNKELWNEARTNGDIQLMPFVDYYSVITWKTLAICIFGTEVASAKFVMKTDDDAFVRINEVLASLRRINATIGVLYGLINSDSRPHRSPDSKWFITIEEWSEETYPPWAHGPGYVVSHDIARAVYKKYKTGSLKMFKLEDVAMGIWIADMKMDGLEVRYENEERVYNVGCRDGYVVAHYQGPREMICLWKNLEAGNDPKCCG